MYSAPGAIASALTEVLEPISVSVAWKPVSAAPVVVSSFTTPVHVVWSSSRMLSPAT